MFESTGRKRGGGVNFCTQTRCGDINVRSGVKLYRIPIAFGEEEDFVKTVVASDVWRVYAGVYSATRGQCPCSVAQCSVY